MITIRAGELFVEKYNEENRTNLTPKEVFRMLAEKVFDYKEPNSRRLRMMTFFNHTIFGTSQGTYYKKFNDSIIGETEMPSFEEAFNTFCDGLENTDCGVEVEKNVYGGCALPKNDEGRNNTTEFNYCDNIHFTIDERYCSFIGSFFTMLVGNFATVINDKNVIWLMYKSFNAYYDFIHDNDCVADKQLPAWNGCYFYQEVMNRNEFIRDKKIKRNKIKTINFLEYLEAVSKLDGVNISNMIFENYSNTNVTCGCITINLGNVKGWFNIFEKIVANDDEDFDIEKYCKLFNKENLLRLSMESGEVTSNMIDPLFDTRKKIKSNEFKGKDCFKFLKEYIKLVMTEKEIEMAKSFGKFLAEAAKARKSFSFKSELDRIFSSKKVVDLGNAIIAFCEKANTSYKSGIPYDVIRYFTENNNRDKLMEFLMLSKFNS